MPLQNRVDPAGAIHAVATRGMFTGNRGAIHDPESRTLLARRFTTRAWLICDCAYKGRKREVFGRNTPGGGPGWTNLFFMDEVTALAAGHRPCFECRREKARKFADCYGKAFGVARPRAAEIDTRLHAERLAAGGRARPVARDALMELPDGAIVAQGSRFLARAKGRLLAWSFQGYEPLPGGPAGDGFALTTPATTLRVLAAGYSPVWHPTATLDQFGAPAQRLGDARQL